MKLHIRKCKQADYEHGLHKRQYAHVGHIKDIICVSKEFYRLPIQHSIGIIVHEVGHLLTMKYSRSNNERDANRMAKQYFGVSVKYIDTKYGNRLEYISLATAKRIESNLFDTPFFR